MVEILVRAFNPERDFPAWTRIHSDPAVAAMLLQFPYTPQEVWERRYQNGARDRDRWLVAEIDGEVVGTIGFHSYAGRRAHVGSLGMAVDARFHGQGVGSRLVEAVIELADNWLSLRRIELEVYVDNDPAVALYRKYGFRIEGTHRAYAVRDGILVDAYTMARLREPPPLLIDE